MKIDAFAVGAFCVPAVAAFGTALAQTGFTPVSELPGVAEPPTGVVPVNAGQVLSGLASRYVVQRVLQAPDYFRTAVTSDFVSYMDLPYTPDLNGDILAGVSDDGARIATTLTSTDTGHLRRIAYWTPGSPPTVLNLDSLFNQNAVGMSADGRYIAAYTGVFTGAHAWLIDTHNGNSKTLVDGNGEGGDESIANCISSDGLWVAGGVGGAPGPRFLWSEASGHEYLDSGVVHKPLPLFMSDGAGVIVCRSEVGGPPMNDWVTPVRVMGRWRHLGDGQGHALTVEFLRHDGGLAGGTINNTAVLWTATLGMVDCGTELRARGINTRGWTLTHARYGSPDGRTIVGQGRAPGTGVERWWVAHVEPFAAADIGKAGGLDGGDGRLDNNDFIAFINRFFAQDERADVGKAGGERGGDGTFDANDFIAFIGLFFGSEP
jgi:hypothetical protein